MPGPSGSPARPRPGRGFGRAGREQEERTGRRRYCPYRSLPQQWAWPAASSAQAWWSPTVGGWPWPRSPSRSLSSPSSRPRSRRGSPPGRCRHGRPRRWRSRRRRRRRIRGRRYRCRCRCGRDLVGVRVDRVGLAGVGGCSVNGACGVLVAAGGVRAKHEKHCETAHGDSSKGADTAARCCSSACCAGAQAESAATAAPAGGRMTRWVTVGLGASDVALGPEAGVDGPGGVGGNPLSSRRSASSGR